MAQCRAELTITSAQLAASPAFVLAANDVICGWYLLAPHSATEIELDFLYVDPLWMGHGYGRALIEHAQRTAHGLGYAALLIVADPHAAPFYERLGAAPIGERASGQHCGPRAAAAAPGGAAVAALQRGGMGRQ